MSIPASFVATGGPRPVLSVRRLTVERAVGRAWPWRGPIIVRTVDDVHFNLHRGEALGIVGEPGCGKSTLARALVGLQAVAGGGIVYDGRDLARLEDAEWRPLRRAVQLVFQDPRASLDPHLTAAESIDEPLVSLCPELDAAARAARVEALLERLGAHGLGARHPHELTDAECRRVALARALAVEPRVLICDEPAAGLAGAERDAALALLADVQRERDLALIIVSDDLALVRELCDRVLVMYLGRIMEQASKAELFAQPRHPYSRMLLARAAEATPEPPPAPGTLQIPSGCAFRTRCPMADDMCARETPHLRRVGETGYAACHYVQGGESADGNPAEAPREGYVSKARRITL